MVHREDVATTTLGVGGVAGAAALRHEALERAYAGGPRPNLPVVNLPLLHERRLLARGAKGRAAYLTGAALGTVSAPTAAVGINRMYTRRKRKPTSNTAKRDDRQDKPRPTFLEAGLTGARNAVVDRTHTVSNPAPAKLVAGNYLAGLGIASGAGGLSHLAMRKAKIPGHGKAAIATAVGTTAGALSLPAQSEITSRASHGRYEVTATGVRRRKAKRVPASSAASVHEGRSRMGADMHRYRQETVGKLADPLEYRGSDLSSRHKRAIVGSVVGPPFLGDIAQASTAASMAPPHLRKETAARTYAGSQAGGQGGTAAGAYGAAYLAHKSPQFRRGAEAVNARVEHAQSAFRRRVGLKQPTEKLGAKVLRKSPGFVRRAAGSRAVQAATAPLRRYPAVAAVGAAAGGAVGGQAGLQTGYGSALRRERKWRQQEMSRRGPTATHGGKVGKRDDNRALTTRERKRLAHQKQISAGLSMAGGTAGLTSLGVLAASRHPKLKHLQRHQLPLVTAGAGVGGINAFLGAHVQQREAKQQLAPQPRRTVVIVRPDEVASKAFGVPRVPRVGLRPTGARRAPGMRAGTIRQTRYPNGITRVSTVRGGLA